MANTQKTGLNRPDRMALPLTGTKGLRPTYAGQRYNNPNKVRSSIDGKSGVQLQPWHYERNAIMEADAKIYFSKLVDPDIIPQHSGNTMAVYFYPRILSTLNMSSQGLDYDPETGAISNGVTDSSSLYGGSTAISDVLYNQPFLGEVTGSEHRLQLNRTTRIGKVYRYGIHIEYTEESMLMDSDPMLYSRTVNRLTETAVTINEDLTAIDLLLSAGVVVYPGTAATIADMDQTSVVSFETLESVSAILDANQCPYDTKVFLGSQKIDTLTISQARVAYTHPMVRPLLTRMTDPATGKAALKYAHNYNNDQALPDELGQIDRIRFIINQRMPYFAGKGAKLPAWVTGYPSSNGKFNVYPILIIGKDSFTTLGYSMPGVNKGNSLFRFYEKKPGEYFGNNDKYGSSGFISCQWYYGFMALRPDFIAVIWTVVGNGNYPDGDGRQLKAIEKQYYNAFAKRKDLYQIDYEELLGFKPGDAPDKDDNPVTPTPPGS